MSKYLLEIGTEELPYKFIPSAMAQLKSGFEKLLNDNKLEFDGIKTYGTPRRLTVIISGLSDVQKQETKLAKGPIANIAYSADGKITPAGLGFAKKNGVEPEQLFIQDGYVFAKVEHKSKSVKDVLQSEVKSVVLKLQGSHFMRWADLDVKFQRPVRWVVSLFDDKQLEIEIAGIKSSNVTRGHRFAQQQTIEISNIDEYLETLKKVNVIANQDLRKQSIIELATQKAKTIGAEVLFDEELLDEVTYLTEYPVPILCDFEEKYLAVPHKVLTTVMASHQRYFPIFKDGKLLNRFITMANYVGDAFENIKLGNEKVIKARFDDAIFFFNEDTKKSLESKLENLKGVTFQKGLGSVYDKTMRIVELGKFIQQELSVVSSTIDRTALLCKCDLVTQLVFEFTELQGYIGADYARLSDEAEAVCQGIKEHYYPLNADSEIPNTIEGQVVSVADKIDTICATFAFGQKPTGSADPLGVRRATLGIIKIIARVNNFNINLSKLIEKSVEILPVEVEDKKTLVDEIKEFFEQRLFIFYADSYRKDVLDACISNKNVLSDLNNFISCVQIVDELVKSNDYALFHENANRVIRILKDTVITSKVDDDLLTTEAEKNLNRTFCAMSQSNKSLNDLKNDLKQSIPTIQEFFDKVLVMDKDEKIKNNRLALLNDVKLQFAKLADFSKIVH